MDARELSNRIPNAALAFRGYNITNLGRSHELLDHPRYGATLEECLVTASRVCREMTGRAVDLVARVRESRETDLESYTEAIALVMAIEEAQLRLLRECFGIDHHRARMSMGYSLGEISAVVAGGVFHFEDAMHVPLALADDCAELAHDATLAVLFSRGAALPVEDIRRMCVVVNQQGRGILGISSFLSPNSLIMIGQGDTLDRFKSLADRALPMRVSLRKNDHRWPPFHTPIVRLRNIPSRASVLMNTLPNGRVAPKPAVFSLVTGKFSYNDYNARDILYEWTDHPQRLWDAVYETLSMGIDLVIHVGPEPNIIPATYRRLRENIEAQTRGSIGMRALSAVVRRPWISSLLPERAALLRAPLIAHLILEDWLLQQPP